MTEAKQLPLVSVEEYLAGELDGEVRHEYVGGYVHAMAGAKNVHNRVATNFLISLGSQLRGKACEVMNSDVKVRIELPTHTRFYYPDGMVVCDSNPAEETFQDRPIVLAEVLSDSTRRVDQTEKRDAYLGIDSVAVYLMIETNMPEVTLYRRSGPGEGLTAFKTERHTGIDIEIALPEINATLSLADLYERMDFAQ